MATETLYEKIGGEKAIDAAVDLFYRKVLADGRIKHFFEGVDMQRQGKMQKNFLTFAFGGPKLYSGQNMRVAHMRLVEEKGLNDSHFDAVLENLAATLRELRVAEELIRQAAAVAETVRADVVGRTA
ncbi:MAG: group I truncated hemoglobin [Trichloromonadaceae bacterium]